MEFESQQGTKILYIKFGQRNLFALFLNPLWAFCIVQVFLFEQPCLAEVVVVEAEHTTLAESLYSFGKGWFFGGFRAIDDFLVVFS